MSFQGEKVLQNDEFTRDLFRFLQLLCEGHNNGKLCTVMSFFSRRNNKERHGKHPPWELKLTAAVDPLVPSSGFFLNSIPHFTPPTHAATPHFQCTPLPLQDTPRTPMHPPTSNALTTINRKKPKKLIYIN